jgi:hypothetical protein
MNISINSDNVLKILEFISHGLISLILVIVLKDKHPIILTILLYLIVAYLIRTNNMSFEVNSANYIPPLLLPSIGISILLLNYIINNVNSTENEYKCNKFKIWKAPFWSIFSYYVISLI